MSKEQPRWAEGAKPWRGEAFLRIAKDETDESSPTTARPERSEYPARMVERPSVHGKRWDLHDFREALRVKVWIVDADDVAESLDELRSKGRYRDSHWFWVGAQNNGRGAMRVNGKVKYASRVLWAELRGGSPDTRRVVRRSCDTEECVNPWHAKLVRQGSWRKKPQVSDM